MRDCRKHYDKGYDCGEGLAINNSGIKWYYDDELVMCLNFVYKGCGGNENRFNLELECLGACRPEDDGNIRLECTIGKEEKLIPCGNKHAIERSYHGSVNECPPGYRCSSVSIAMDYCCNRDLYYKNVYPKCENGKQALEYLGKFCEEEFCPLDTNCIQLELFAHCCPK
uniref:BPTI/Kunitz inhibitor domain-containing protein n=1 Tax=Meloidogyne enterolobii TaxID=390850 RepID=A0A6V7VD94_MELEN|nr:unnamed protein product [Meloidogyne enterolobii]